MREHNRARIVVDTNILVSATISRRGKPYQFLQAWKTGALTLLADADLRAEVDEVLHRPKIQQKYRVDDQEIADLLFLLDTLGAQASRVASLPVQVRDLKDEYLLALALGGGADYLVTGDQDLLVLNGDPRIGYLAIVTVATFLVLFDAGSAEQYPSE